LSSVTQGLPNIAAEHAEEECCRKPPRTGTHIFSASTENYAAKCSDRVVLAARISRLKAKLIQAILFAAAERLFQAALSAQMAGWSNGKASGEISSVASNILTVRAKIL
jgi:hypothetical protein